MINWNDIYTGDNEMIFFGILIVAIAIYAIMYVMQIRDFRKNGVHPVSRPRVVTTWILLLVMIFSLSGGIISLT